MDIKPGAFVFFGRSGCGKGTQAKLLIKFLTEHDPKRQTIYVETGHLLRDFSVSAKNFSTEKTGRILAEGGLLPEFVPVCMWGNFLMGKATGADHFVFDGVSRREQEAPILHSALDFFEYSNRHILLIDTSNEWSIKHLLARGRNDDRREDIQRRLAWFDKNVRLALRFFENNPAYHFHTVNGEQPIEAVHQEILRKTGLAG